MWNLEQTERLIVRLIPIVILATGLALVLMSLSLQPERLSPAFNSPAANTLPFANN